MTTPQTPQEKAMEHYFDETFTIVHCPKEEQLIRDCLDIAVREARKERDICWMLLLREEKVPTNTINKVRLLLPKSNETYQTGNNENERTSKKTWTQSE